MSATLNATKKRMTGKRSNRNFMPGASLPARERRHRRDSHAPDQADERHQLGRGLALDQLEVRRVGVRLAEGRVDRLPAPPRDPGLVPAVVEEAGVRLGVGDAVDYARRNAERAGKRG